MNIYEKLLAITTELSSVAKNLRVGEGRSSYKAVGEADVLAAVKPLEDKYKVYSYPAARKIVDSDTLTTKSIYNGNEKETTKFYMRLETTYRFVNTEDPKEIVDITTYGDGVDSGDKAPGKAMTYSDKYALLKAYKIITGDDPDQQKSPEEKVERMKPWETKEAPLSCADCGALITPTKLRNGETWSVTDMAKYAELKFGRHLCADCMKKAQKNDQNNG